MENQGEGAPHIKNLGLHWGGRFVLYVGTSLYVLLRFLHSQTLGTQPRVMLRVQKTLLLVNRAFPEGPARHLNASRQTLTPHCPVGSSDSQLPSPQIRVFLNLGFGEPMFCTLDSRGFRHFRAFRDFRKSSNQPPCLWLSELSLSFSSFS